MNEGQKVGVMRALFDKIFARKKNKINTDGYKVKHGRGEDMNNDMVGLESDGQDPYLKAGVSLQERGFRSEMPKSKSKKMLYSSVPEEERNRKH